MTSTLKVRFNFFDQNLILCNLFEQRKFVTTSVTSKTKPAKNAFLQE